MLRSDYVRILIPLLAGLFLTSALITAPQAAEPRIFVIPSSDGYGISECFDAGRDCGRVVADAWCEAHGHGKALAFGKAEDMTASIRDVSAPADAKTPAPVDPAAVIVSCGD